MKNTVKNLKKGKRKGLINITQLLITLVLVGIIVVGISSFYGSVGQQYGKSSTDLESMSAISQVNNMSAALQASTNNINPAGSLFNIPFMIAAGVYQSLAIMFQIPGIFAAMITNFSLMTGLPLGWVEGGIISLLTVIIVMEIISAIMHW